MFVTLKKTLFLKLVNYKAQFFWVNGVHLVPNGHTPTYFAVGAIHLHGQNSYTPFYHM